jgi:hypothetical protein
MDIDIPEGPVKGRVLLFTSRDANVAPAMSMNQEVTTHIRSVLNFLSGRYSPIRSQFFFWVFFFTS